MWGVLSASLFFLPFNRLFAGILLAAAAAMGVYHQILTPLGLAYLVPIAMAIWLRQQYRQQRAAALILEIFLVASSLALFCHLIPGFNNPLMVVQEKTGPLSSPYSLYYNFDKALVPFLLFACLPTLFNAGKTEQQVGISAWVLLVLAVPALLLLAVALGGLKIELYMPTWILAFMMANLFFVSLAEEALFRGYLQQRIRQWLGAYPALVITALLFGAAHFAGGMLMVIFATLAGVIYGLAWMWSRRLWVPVVFHFGLNLTHLLFFTYPVYQHP
ncbi:MULTISPECIES: CPBP family intramembrane glutamic endopeptidase [unclassified Serratia (in: enterobacteria)]|uniref:CPBP family intramembrane glutamic endopeptidase n=1 Tax=unclassified Serratia (in: enterobacteria) TaxID=2647522 RepID=UPI0005008B53|nr:MULTISPECIES: CPBP family intramembrane glutamic endopeptidase [unclassified Serratia (in: enterobacteria)]KFK95104.1 CAAX protease [Serratia sp. Ag2]KFK96279.1 CAAX protease [Serratia sp. Ag1]